MNELGHSSIELDIVGRRGLEYFKRREAPINTVFRDVLINPNQERAS